jgi:tRNA threonylcarbamoyladenosine biosynthesis protein TsaE
MTPSEKYRVSSNGQEETEQFAEKIGNQLRGGEIIELTGDLGTGKTAFVRGLAKGTGSENRVSSPTFTVSNVYSSPKLKLYHYDFYRLDDFRIIKNELSEVVEDSQNVVVLEWAEEVQNVLPKDHIRVNLETESENGRHIKIEIPAKFNYIKVNP